MGEFLLEGFVHVLLEVGGFDIFDDRSLEKDVKIGDLFQNMVLFIPPPFKMFMNRLSWTLTDVKPYINAGSSALSLDLNGKTGSQ